MKERRLLRTITKFGTVFAVNVIVLGFLALGFGREYLRNLEIERSIRMLEDEQSALQDKKLEALSVIESLSSEYYLEQEGRKKHGLARPGEELVVVYDAPATSFANDVAGGGEAEVSNLARWYYYFFDHERFAALRTL